MHCSLKLTGKMVVPKRIRATALRLSSGCAMAVYAQPTSRLWEK